MNRPRDPFGAAVAAIRTRIRSGELVQGEQLVVSEVARDLRLSATPVREALARLAGEGLIEDRRGAGYFAWRLDAVDLAELYDLQVSYLRLALTRAQEGHGAITWPAGPPATADTVLTMEALLGRLVQLGRSVTLLRAHALLADRLAPARRVEAQVLPQAGAEWAELSGLPAEPVEPLAIWVEAYGLRRRAAAADLVRAMRSAAGA